MIGGIEQNPGPPTTHLHTGDPLTTDDHLRIAGNDLISCFVKEGLDPLRDSAGRIPEPTPFQLMMATGPITARTAFPDYLLPLSDTYALLETHLSRIQEIVHSAERIKLHLFQEAERVSGIACRLQCTELWVCPVGGCDKYFASAAGTKCHMAYFHDRSLTRVAHIFRPGLLSDGAPAPSAVSERRPLPNRPQRQLSAPRRFPPRNIPAQRPPHPIQRSRSPVEDSRSLIPLIRAILQQEMDARLPAASQHRVDDEENDYWQQEPPPSSPYSPWQSRDPRKPFDSVLSRQSPTPYRRTETHDHNYREPGSRTHAQPSSLRHDHRLPRHGSPPRTDC